MKGKLVSGWHLILNRTACSRWMRSYGLNGRYPIEYPVLAQYLLCDDGTSEPTYIHPFDAENMNSELKKAVEFLRGKK